MQQIHIIFREFNAQTITENEQYLNDWLAKGWRVLHFQALGLAKSSAGAQEAVLGFQAAFVLVKDDKPETCECDPKPETEEVKKHRGRPPKAVVPEATPAQ